MSYTGQVPKIVQKVTESIAAAFIDQNLRDREVMADGTNQFLEVQLEDARRRLVDQEKKLENYRVKYSGQLPTQLEANLAALAAAPDCRCSPSSSQSTATATSGCWCSDNWPTCRATRVRPAPCGARVTPATPIRRRE